MSNQTSRPRRQASAAEKAAAKAAAEQAAAAEAAEAAAQAAAEAEAADAPQDSPEAAAPPEPEATAPAEPQEPSWPRERLLGADGPLIVEGVPRHVLAGALTLTDKDALTATEVRELVEKFNARTVQEA